MEFCFSMETAQISLWKTERCTVVYIAATAFDITKTVGWMSGWNIRTIGYSSAVKNIYRLNMVHMLIDNFSPIL